MLRRALNLREGGREKHQRWDGGEVALAGDTLGAGWGGCPLRVGRFGCQRFGCRGKPWEVQRHKKVGSTVLPHISRCGIAVAPPHSAPPGPTHRAGVVQSRSRWQAPGSRAGLMATSAQGHHATAHTERVGSFPDQTGTLSPAGQQ